MLALLPLLVPLLQLEPELVLDISLPLPLPLAPRANLTSFERRLRLLTLKTHHSGRRTWSQRFTPFGVPVLQRTRLFHTLIFIAESGS